MSTKEGRMDKQNRFSIICIMKTIIDFLWKKFVKKSVFSTKTFQ